jgi:RNA polymerase sigma-70 factor (ECF subfamily)
MPSVPINFKANYKPKLAVLEYPIITSVKDTRLREFEANFHEYYEALHRYAFSLIRDSEEAKDIVQQVFIKFWEKTEDLEVHASVKSYLYRSVYHQCLNKVRDQKVRLRHAAGVLKENTEAVFLDETVAKETQARILQAIESLPAQCGIIFKKSRFEEKKYGEIAAELNLSVKTVEAQMSKALKLMREKLLIILAFMSTLFN